MEKVILALLLISCQQICFAREFYVQATWTNEVEGILNKQVVCNVDEQSEYGTIRTTLRISPAVVVNHVLISQRPVFELMKKITVDEANYDVEVILAEELQAYDNGAEKYTIRYRGKKGVEWRHGASYDGKKEVIIIPVLITKIQKEAKPPAIFRDPVQPVVHFPDQENTQKVDGRKALQVPTAIGQPISRDSFKRDVKEWREEQRKKYTLTHPEPSVQVPGEASTQKLEEATTHQVSTATIVNPANDTEDTQTSSEEQEDKKYLQTLSSAVVKPVQDNTKQGEASASEISVHPVQPFMRVEEQDKLNKQGNASGPEICVQTNIVKPDLSVHYPTDNVPKQSEEDIRVVYFSDTHGLHENMAHKIPEADILIFGGDLTDWGFEEEVSSFNKFLGKLRKKYPKMEIIVIAGNHDYSLDEDFVRMHGASLSSTPQYKKKGVSLQYTPPRKALSNSHHYLQGSSATVKGLVFWGAPWIPPRSCTAFNYESIDLAKMWNLIPVNTDILVTHTPPKGYRDVVNFINAGCPELQKQVEKIKPRLHLFGHIHEGYGRTKNPFTDFVNGSICKNTYNSDKPYEPINKPVVMDIRKLNADVADCKEQKEKEKVLN